MPMKKYLAIAVLGSITLASCKKDYTCACTANNQTYNFAYTIKTKRGNARETCQEYAKEYAATHAGGRCELSR